MRVYILANGSGNRWNNYKGVPKYLITIDGETLIDRMIRLLRENNLNDIWIVGSHVVSGCKNYVNSKRLKAEAFQEIAELSDEPFILLNADCYYTEAIIKDCATRECKRWLHWENPDRNLHTGKGYGEGYIHKVTDVKWWRDKITEYNALIRCEKINANGGNDWMINRFMYGWEDVYTHQPNNITEYDVLWDDETDDFDFPEDLDRFLRITGHNG